MHCVWKISQAIHFTCALMVSACLVARDSTAAEPLAGGKQEINLQHDGMQRRSLLYVPSRQDTTASMPLVIMLHGGGGKAEIVCSGTGWAELAEQEKFIAAFPDGTARQGRRASVATNPQTWNSGAGEGPAARAGVDDVGFLKALILDISKRVPVDQSRVYLAGHSNGAGMAYRAGIELADQVAVIGTMAGHLFVDAETLSSPVSAIHIVGDSDPLSPLEGGDVDSPWGGGQKLKGRPAPRNNAEKWATMLGLSPTPKSVVGLPVGIAGLAWGPDPKTGAEVRFLVIEGHGHGWAGGKAMRLPERMVGPTADRLNATRTMWDFFKEHPKK